MIHLHIFLSSPGDVSRERQLAREAIEQLQSERAHRNWLKVEVVAWDKPGAGAAMPASLEPQEAINQGLKKPSECDIVVVILWARMGTRLSEKHRKPDGSHYRSGTEYEFLDAIAAADKDGKPDVLVYRREGAPNIRLDDPELKPKNEQWNTVQEFFSEFRNTDGSFRRFFKEYDSPTDFKELLDQDLRDVIDRHLEQEPAGRDEPPIEQDESIWKDPPFPGLRAFTAKEAPIFFGRGRETDDLIQRLGDANYRFATIIAASGSGKSSLVAAGLLPSLQKNALLGSEDWVWVRFTPGEVGGNPFMALATGFKLILEKHGRRPRDMSAELQTSPDALTDLITLALEGKPNWAEVLLFADQFEELFTVVEAQYQQPFIELIAAAAKLSDVRIVATLRSDFYQHCAERPELAELLRMGSYPLPAPGVGSVLEMIARPANRAGLRFEEGLTERILNDLGTEPGALALMAFALAELYKGRKADGYMTHATYDGFNRIQGAIGKRADEEFGKLEADVRAELGNVFLGLVEVDERGGATRRRISREQVARSGEADKLVSALTEARLLVEGRGPDNEAMVEVAHEALFHSWPRLRDWIEDSSDSLRFRQRLVQAAEGWDSSSPEVRPDLLWRGKALEEALEWAQKQGEGLPRLAKEFLKASRAEGIFEDEETGLMWKRNDNGKNTDWHGANEYAKSLKLGGYTDWRLPTIEELETLYDPESQEDIKVRKPLLLNGWREVHSRRMQDNRAL